MPPKRANPSSTPGYMAPKISSANKQRPPVRPRSSPAIEMPRAAPARADASPPPPDSDIFLDALEQSILVSSPFDTHPPSTPSRVRNSATMAVDDEQKVLVSASPAPSSSLPEEPPKKKRKHGHKKTKREKIAGWNARRAEAEEDLAKAMANPLRHTERKTRGAVRKGAVSPVHEGDRNGYLLRS